jgi:hypothetical protein
MPLQQIASHREDACAEFSRFQRSAGENPYIAFGETQQRIGAVSLLICVEDPAKGDKCRSLKRCEYPGPEADVKVQSIKNGRIAARKVMNGRLSIGKYRAVACVAFKSA